MAEQRICVWCLVIWKSQYLFTQIKIIPLQFSILFISNAYRNAYNRLGKWRLLPWSP